MIPLPIIITIAIVGILALATRRASASPGSGGGGSSPPAGAAPGTGGTVRTFGAWAHRCPNPFPPGAMLELIRAESGGKPEIVVADKVNGGSELGGTQLVVEHDAAGNPQAHSGYAGSAIHADVDPLTVAGAVWGAQVGYDLVKGQYTDDLRELGMAVPGDDEVGAWITILNSLHSVGRGGAKKLWMDGKAAGKLHPIASFTYWAFDKMPPTIGRMGPALIRKRMRRLLKLPEAAAKIFPLPARIGPIGPRPDGVPEFDAVKVKRYILAERARGTKPRAANGAPPGV